MNAWKIILATVVIFVTGVVTGGLLVRYAETPLLREHAGAPARAASHTSALRMEFLRRMHKELDLTADQRQRVDKLLKEHQENIRKIIEPLQPDIDEEILLAKEDFVDLLTPAQRARFEESLRQQQWAKEHSAPAATNTVASTSTNK